MNYIDLHVHSCRSDGTMTPKEVIDLAIEKKLKAIALTDHDTTEGIPEALSAAEGTGLEVIPGIEFSTVRNGRDVHIVGLDIDYDSPRMQHKLQELQNGRSRRNQQMIDLMAADGIDISQEQMLERFGDQLWTRAHFARYLAEHGYVRNMWDAFETHVGDTCRYYVPREKVSPADMVRFIREGGGIPVLAHPFQYHLDEEGRYTLIRELKYAGLIGIEAMYSTHTGSQESEACKYARHFGLCISGGSDFHGANKPAIYLGTGKGNLRIPWDLIENMRQYRDSH